MCRMKVSPIAAPARSVLLQTLLLPVWVLSPPLCPHTALLRLKALGKWNSGCNRTRNC